MYMYVYFIRQLYRCICMFTL